MNNFISRILGLLLVCSWCGCGAAAKNGKQTSKASFTKAAGNGFTNRTAYILRAGGPHSVTTITNAPVANPVSIALVNPVAGSLDFRLTNGEHHAILLWNVRVQVKSKGAGTDGFGWDTVADGYPDGQSHFPSGSSGTFHVTLPEETPWRVCVIYSTDWTDSGKSYSGDYEVISQPLLR